MTRASCVFKTIAAGVTILACIGTAAFAEGEISMIQIDEMTVGKPPPGFSFAHTGRGSNGAWTVVADPTAKGGLAVEQTSTDTTDYRFPLAIPASWSAKNLRAEIRFKAVGGKVDRAGGIAVRVEDPDNYYIARANALEDNVTIYHVVNGRRTERKRTNMKVASNQWHTLRVDFQGSHFTVTYNGKKAIDWDDETFKDAGRVGVWTKADSVTLFDDFSYGAK
jgi:3-keto-disaccharide hydrolase